MNISNLTYTNHLKITPPENFKLVLTKTAIENGYVPEQEFIAKCFKLAEILTNKRICHIIGPPGSGKSATWMTVLHTLIHLGQAVIYNVIYPQTLSIDEFAHCLTDFSGRKEPVVPTLNCQEGSTYAQKTKNNELGTGKWMVLDGYLGQEQAKILDRSVESPELQNSINNESILSESLSRILIEMSNLEHASISMMTKGGSLYLKDRDTCWKAYLQSWIDRTRKQHLQFDSLTKTTFACCFWSHYEKIKPSIETFQRIIPTNHLSIIQAICTTIDALLVENLSKIQQKAPEEQEMGYRGLS